MREFKVSWDDPQSSSGHHIGPQPLFQVAGPAKELVLASPFLTKLLSWRQMAISSDVKFSAVREEDPQRRR